MSDPVRTVLDEYVYGAAATATANPPRAIDYMGGDFVLEPPPSPPPPPTPPEPRVRPQEGGGFVEDRPPAAGPPVDERWWYETALEVVRRLPGGQGAGEGPTLKWVEALARVLRAALERRHVDDEKSLRRLFDVPAGTTLDLREVVVSRLVDLVRPVALSGAPLLPPSSAESAAASASGTPRPDKPKVLPAVPPSPTPRRRPGAAPRCQLCHNIDPEAALERTILERQTAHDIFRRHPDLAAAIRDPKGFDRAVPLDLEAWKARYRYALGVANASNVNREDLTEDFHACPGVGESSNRAIGNAVHEELQHRYVTDDEFANNHVVIEQYLSRGGRREPGPPEWLARIPGIDEDPGVFGALAYALGLPPRRPLRPDIADLSLMQIVEIKPIRAFHCGVLQLWQYIDNFNLAKFFDEKTKAGPKAVGKRLAPGRLPAHLLGPIQVAERLEGRDRERFRDLLAFPYMHSSVPGVVFYTLSRAKQDDLKKTLHSLLTATGIAVGVIVTVVIAAVAFVVIAELAAGTAAGAGTEVLIGGGLTCKMGAEGMNLIVEIGPEIAHVLDGLPVPAG
jgi:hypothetical protein